MKSIRTIQRSSERAQREVEIRADLLEFDEQFPFAHHELLIRYAAGFLASTFCATLYEMLRGKRKK